MDIEKQRVRARRIQLGLSQKRVGEKANIGQELVSRIERGEYHPGEGIIGQLARALEVSIEWLCGSNEPGEIPDGFILVPTSASNKDPEVVNYERALFKAMGTGEFETEDFDNVRKALDETKYVYFKKAVDAEGLALDLLNAAKELRDKKLPINSGSIGMLAVVNAAMRLVEETKAVRDENKK